MTALVLMTLLLPQQPAAQLALSEVVTKAANQLVAAAKVRRIHLETCMHGGMFDHDGQTLYLCSLLDVLLASLLRF